VIAALRQNRPADYAAMGVAVLGVCIPTFVTAPLLVLVFAAWLGVLPTAGWPAATQPWTSAWRYLVLPVVVLSLPQIAIISRLTRAGMIEVMRSNYVRTARAKGLPPRRVIGIHALRNALIPVVTIIGLQVGTLVAGAVLTETIFSWPGVGKWLIEAVGRRDYPALQGGVMLISAIVMLVNLAVDVLYGVINPRIRHGG
jgi:dipeptide transport system permease protein